MKIVLVGPPGSGKGTLAQGLEKKLGFKHLSVGQVIRQESENNSRLAKVINAGQLVDDETTKQILKNHLFAKEFRNGFILDGYPRSLTQAKNLNELIEVDFVICLDISNEEIFRRLQNRLTCPKCGEVYNKLLGNQTVCAKCHTVLEQRQDDTTETIQNRIKIYEQNIAPILDLYQDKLLKIDVLDAPEKTLEKVVKILEEKKVDCKKS